MEDRPELRPYHGEMVWTNANTEAIRKKECLCHNCDNLKPDQPDNCTKAEALYQIIKRENLALMITRCPTWERKKSK